MYCLFVYILDGSVSIDLLWKELVDAKVDIKQITGRDLLSKEVGCFFSLLHLQRKGGRTFPSYC